MIKVWHSFVVKNW